MDVEYRHLLANGLDAFVGLSADYQGQQWGDLSAEPAFNIPGYAIFDARAGIETVKGLTASLWLQNIANRYYWTDLNFAGDAYIQDAGMPRNVGVTVSYRF